jgi:ubiquinone biosynthesis protein UbiJ
MHKLIVEAFDNVIKREIAEADAVRAEIKARGTYWAGDEIWTLRRQVAALRNRVAELEKSKE